MASITDKMAEMEGDDDVPKIKLGDASCAAPFTSKLGHVSASKCLFSKREYHLVDECFFSYTYHPPGPLHSRCYRADVQDFGTELFDYRV
jgi:hypothetical protein